MVGGHGGRWGYVEGGGGVAAVWRIATGGPVRDTGRGAACASCAALAREVVSKVEWSPSTKRCSISTSLTAHVTSRRS